MQKYDEEEQAERERQTENTEFPLRRREGVKLLVTGRQEFKGGTDERLY